MQKLKEQQSGGTTKLHRLEENLGAVDIRLTPDDLREIEEAASQIEVHGARYPAHLQQRVGRSSAAPPLVSIVIPAYVATPRQTELLAETLDTVAAQSCREFETLVVDDGSPVPVDR